VNSPGFALIGGGARSGKSAFALRLAQSRGKYRVFVATAVAFDAEMRERIDRHIEERGARFETLESPFDLDDAIARLASVCATRVEVVVVDCLTLWLSNLLLEHVPTLVIEQRIDTLATTLADAPFGSIVVSNEVGMGLVPETPLGRAFRDLSGRAHQRLARSASELYFATMGTVIRLRPSPIALADENLAP
jgi:adenosylcobinamide kinase / adenosylcobinamide-phosphate guanylyltransferase